VVEAAERLHRGVQRLLASMAERRMAEIVRQGHRFAEILVETQGAAERAGDLRHLERMGETRSIVIALVIDEDLRLVLEPPERRRVDDAVAVALERAAGRRLRLGMQAAAGFPRQGRMGRERLRTPGLFGHRPCVYAFRVAATTSCGPARIMSPAMWRMIRKPIQATP